MELYLMYLRKSRADRDFTDEPIMDTLKRHKARLDSFCKAQGYFIDQVFYEVVSADSIAARPEMINLLHAVESGKYAGVIVVDLERLCRGDSIDQGIVMNTFKYSHTAIITPYKSYDFSNEYDEESAEYGLMMGRNEYRRIKRRLWNGRLDSVREGKYVGGTPPYGYRSVKLKKQKGFILEIIPEEADVVRLIFDMYVNGFLDNGSRKEAGSSVIARVLNERGYKNQFGNPWHQHLISKIIQDATYTGKIVWQRRVTKKVIQNGTLITTSLSNNPEKQIFQGLHEAIISDELFQAAQVKRIAAPAPHIRRKYPMRNPFCGIVYCGLCGSVMRLRSPDSTGKRALCCNNINCGCVGSYIDLVEDTFLESLQKWAQGYEVECSPEQDYTLQKSTLNAAIEEAEKEQRSMHKQLSKTYELLEKEVYTIEVFQERSSALKEQLQNLQIQIDTAKAELSEIAQYEAQRDSFLPRIQNLLDKYYSLESIEEKNQLIKNVINRIEYKKTTRGRTHANEFELKIYPLLPKL